MPNRRRNKPERKLEIDGTTLAQRIYLLLLRRGSKTLDEIAAMLEADPCKVKAKLDRMIQDRRVRSYLEEPFLAILSNRSPQVVYSTTAYHRIVHDKSYSWLLHAQAALNDVLEYAAKLGERKNRIR